MQRTFDFALVYAFVGRPDYATHGVVESTLTSGLAYQPAATAFIKGADGRDYAYVFPTLFYRDPQLPGLEFVRTDESPFQFSRVLHDITMGNGRDFAVLSDGTRSSPSFVIVDAGSEYAFSDPQSWPYGHVWVATDRGNGFEFQQISSVRAFNHAVASGDLNGDGLPDIVISNMGVKSGGVHVDLHAYLQQPDGSFVQDKYFARELSSSWGSGAVAIADINQNGNVEIIQVNYLYYLPLDGGPDWGGVRILSRHEAGEYLITSTLPREGLFNTMGATRVVAFDYDRDGDLDLILSFEGSLPDIEGLYTGNGLEIYENDGTGAFTRVTDSMLSRNAWSFQELQFREFEIVDFDGDGYLDIVLNGWGGSATRNGSGLDISPLLFRNDGGQRFTQLSSINTDGLVVPNVGWSTAYLRTLSLRDEGLELFSMQYDGTPVTLTLMPLYRDVPEDLIVFGTGTVVRGYGGDDRFFMQGDALFVDGGAGLDAAVYGFRYQDAVVGRAGQEWSVGREGFGADRLINVERIEFSDSHLALDIEGHAGSTAKILGAVFGKEFVANREYAGTGLHLLDSGMSYTQLLSLALDVALRDARSNATVVDLLYKNLVGDAPSASEQAYFVDLIETGQHTQVSLAEFAADLELNTANINLVGLAQAGLEYWPIV